MMFGKDNVWGGSGLRVAGPPLASPITMSGPLMGQVGGGVVGGMGGLGVPASASSQQLMGDKPPVCKYFVNGGCLRGDQCNYLHELPDERHLDVNGLGFIFNSNVHNAQKSVTGSSVGPTAVSSAAGVVGGMVASGVPAGVGSVVGAPPSLPPARKPMKKVIPKYRPPEPCLEHNLPPALALPFHTQQGDVLQSLLASMLDTSNQPPPLGLPRI